MNYLKKIELFGFKSFPERTEIFFTKGVNVIIGPNGSGKSNILDGIVWGMGETKISVLRGIKTEDIIFNGNSKRKPMSSAEVSLVFSINDDEEVIVSRRAFRDGDSIFRLNGKRVRLKDIEEKLYEIGIGGRDYFYISQGSIGNILEMTAFEKRILIEESAGVSRYREKKKEIYKKLIDSENNLRVVESLISESEAEAEKWRKEAQKLNEYRNLKKLQRELKKKIYYYLMMEGEEELTAINEKLKVISTSLSIVREQLIEKEKEFSETRENAWKVEEELSKRKDSFYKVSSELSSKKELLLREQKRVEEIEKELRLSQKWIDEGREFVKLQKEKISNLTEEKTDLEKETADLKKELDSIKVEVDDISQKISEKEDKKNEFSRELIPLLQKVSATENEIKNMEKTYKKYASEIGFKRKEIEEIKNTEEDIVNNLKELEGVTFKSFDKEIEEKKRLIEESEKEFEGIKDSLKRVELEFERINGIYNSVKNEVSVFEESLKNSLAKGVEPIGEMPHYVSSYIESFFELKPFKEELSDDEIYMLPKEDVGIVKEYIQGEYLNYFPDFKIVENLKTAVLSWKENRYNYLSKDGYVVDYDGKVFKLKPAKIIVLKEKLKKSENELEKIKKIFEEKKNIFDNKRKELLLLKEELEKLFEMEAYEKQKKEKTEKKKLVLKERLENLKKRKSIIEDEIEREELEMERIKKEIDSKKEEKSLIEDKIHKVKKDINSIDDEMIKLKRTMDELTKKERIVSSRIFEKQSKISIIDSRISSSKQSIEREEKRIVQLEKKIKELEAEKNKTISNTGILKEKIRELEKEKDKREEELKVVEKEENQLRESLLLIEKDIKSFRRKLSRLSNEENKLQIKKVEVKGELSKLEEKLWNELTMTPEELKKMEFEEFDYEKVFNEEKDIAHKIEALGEINFDSEAEYERYRKKTEYMHQQKNDILESIMNTREALKRIDQETKEKFLETLKAVDENFKEVFRILFNGGKAEVKLIDESEPLESGIEILIKLPGSKLRNLNLLSGGQKALGSLAFLFALFKYKPSPVCIMDEVDAPLDEENIRKFSELIKHFKTNTQFIIVTHNPKTFEIADSSYGITMDEPGVSEVYSIKVNE